MTTAQSIEKQIDYLDQRLTGMEAVMIDPQKFGELSAEVKAQRRDLDRIADCLDKLSLQMSEMKETLTEAKGGWKFMVMAGTAFATIGGAITWAISHVKII